MKKKIFFIITGSFVLLALVLSIALFLLSGDNGDFAGPNTWTGPQSDITDNSESGSNENESLQEENTLHKEKIRQELTASEFAKSNTVNILFLGIDRTEERDFTIGAHRTDAIALATFNFKFNKVKVLRIPRDTYVYIPCIGKMDKVNHAYVWGGMGDKGIQSTIETVNRFVKYAEVDYYFAIDMEPLPKIVDKLGGVDLEVDVDMKTHGYNLSKGFQHLDGEKAYQFIRWRYSGEGEIDRIRRQQVLIAAMFAKVKENKSYISALEIVLQYHKYIKTDLDIKQLFKLARVAAGLENDTISYDIIPGKGRMIDGIWYMVPDKEKTESILDDYYK